MSDIIVAPETRDLDILGWPACRYGWKAGSTSASDIRID